MPRGGGPHMVMVMMSECCVVVGIKQHGMLCHKASAIKKIFL